MICVELAYANPDPVRQERRPEHRRRMEQLRDSGVLFASGPWQEDSGALIIFDTDDEQQARALIEDDSYCQAPGVSIVSVREWNAVFTPN
jgi:uncharacterized protein YciI